MIDTLVRDFVVKHKIEKILLGLSGGLDSIVLLHVLSDLRNHLNFKLRAAHAQHNLQAQAANWDTFCSQQCANLQVPYQCLELDVTGIADLGVESAARKARYNSFASVIAEDECLMTAQHADDQAETVLTQLVRGCGIAGLAAMPSMKQFVSARHARPLLTITRAQLLEYATNKNLDWIEDPSNQDLQFARNAVRHKIIPELVKIRAGAVRTINRVAQNAADAQECLDALAKIDAASVILSPGVLSVEMLKQLSSARQNNVMRYACAACGVATPGRKHLLQLKNILHAAQDAMPELRWGDAVARRYRTALYIEKFQPAVPAFDIDWDMQADLHLGDAYCLSVAKYKHFANSLRVASRANVGSKLSVLMPAGGRRQLKNCWQDWAVPPWQRDQIPLLIKGREIVAVPGYLD